MGDEELQDFIMDRFMEYDDDQDGYLDRHEFKKLLTAYEELQMTRLLKSLEGSDSEVKGLAQSVLKSDWNALKEQLESPAVAALDKANNKKLAAACKKEDSGAAVKAVLAMSR